MKTSVSGARFQKHPKHNVWTGPKIKWFFLTCTGVTTLWTASISFETLTIRYTRASSETIAGVFWAGLTASCRAIVVCMNGTCYSFTEKEYK